MESAFIARITGRVQGVFYRAYVIGQARRLGLAGYARNLEDGSVEVAAEGDTKLLEELVACLWQGSPASRVSGVEASWQAPTGRYTGFNVRAK